MKKPKKIKYYIYHIDGVKIGCTKQLNRRMRLQHQTKYSVLEVHTDIYLASDREQELQKQFGYRVDRQPYYKTISISKKGCEQAGLKAKSTGQLYKAAIISASNRCKAVIAYDYKTNQCLGEFNSAKEANDYFNLTGSGNINKVCKGLRNHTGGYTFIYKT